MKARYIFLLFTLLTLSACREFIPWNDFPEEKFKSYVPYEENQKVVFRNESGEIIEYTANNVKYSKYDFKASMYCACLSTCSFYNRASLTDKNNGRIDYNLGVEGYAEDNLSYSFFVYIDLMYPNSESVQQYTYGNGGYNRKNIEEVLTDTIKFPVKRPNNMELGRKDYVTVVAGKGIIELKIDGKRYTLVEE